MMPNSYPSDRIFNLHRRTMNSFSCILFLWQLHLDLNMCCFINFLIKKSLVQLLSYMLSKHLVETDVKMTSRRQNHQTDVMHMSRHFLAPVGFKEIPVGNARKFFLTLIHDTENSLRVDKSRYSTQETIEPAYEIMALFVLHKLVLQMHMCSHPVGLA